MPKAGRGWRRLGRTIAVIFILLGIFILYVVLLSRTRPPKVNDMSALQWKRNAVSADFYTMKNDWLRKSPSGLFEMYVEGKPFERGIAHGRLGKELVEKQEEYPQQDKDHRDRAAQPPPASPCLRHFLFFR